MILSIQRGGLIVLLVLLVSSLAIAQSPNGTRPKALVFEFADPWTKCIGAAIVLAAAGFDVAPLPLDRSPADLNSEVIVLGSFLSENAEYKAYIKRYAEDLYHYVRSWARPRATDTGRPDRGVATLPADDTGSALG